MNNTVQPGRASCALALALALSGCGGGGDPVEDPGPSNAPDAAALVGRWEGQTAQGQPLSFEVGADGAIAAMVGSFRVQGDACASTATVHLQDAAMRVISGAAQGSTTVAGGDALTSATLAMTFEDESRASGTASAVGRCGSTGALSWNARKVTTPVASVFSAGPSVALESFGSTSFVATDGRRLLMGSSSPSFNLAVAMNPTGNGGVGTWTDTGRYGDLRLNQVGLAIAFVQQAPGAATLASDPANTSGTSFRMLDPRSMGFNHQTPISAEVVLGDGLAGNVNHHGSISTTARPTVPASGAHHYAMGKFFGTLKDGEAEAAPVMADLAIRIDYATGQVEAALSNVLTGADVLWNSATGRPMPAHAMTLTKTAAIQAGSYSVGVRSGDTHLTIYPFGPEAQEVGGTATFAPAPNVTLQGQFGARR